jgi:hypothetical protein
MLEQRRNMCKQLGVRCILLLVLDLTYLIQLVLWQGLMAVQQNGIGHALSMYCTIWPGLLARA